MPLTIKKIEKLRTPGRYFDAHGLYLQVFGPNNRSWVFRYELEGRERWMGLGPVHTTGLVEAREAARRARQMVRDKLDPIETRLAERDAKRADERSKISFKDATKKFLDLHQDTWKNEKHRKQWQSTLESYAFPALGSRPVSAIDDALINEALAPIWLKIPETASRVRHRIKKTIAWVTEGMPLPAKLAKRKAKNHAALPYAEIPAFMAELREREGISARALEFLILNASRTGEVIGAIWGEFDLAEKIWTIPAERMKAGKEHRVPLTDRSLEILASLPREKKNDFVFIGARSGKGLSNMAMLELMKGMRPGFVPHGFRSCYKDWCADRTSFPNIVSEMSLAHTVQGVEGAYRRGDLLQKRVKLAEAWCRYCATPPAKSENNVTPIRTVA